MKLTYIHYTYSHLKFNALNSSTTRTTTVTSWRPVASHCIIHQKQKWNRKQCRVAGQFAHKSLNSSDKSTASSSGSHYNTERIAIWFQQWTWWWASKETSGRLVRDYEQGAVWVRVWRLVAEVLRWLFGDRCSIIISEWLWRWCSAGDSRDEGSRVYRT